MIPTREEKVTGPEVKAFRNLKLCCWSWMDYKPALGERVDVQIF